MDTAVNGSSSCSSLLNPTAEKIGNTFAFCLILVVSMVGNSLIGTIVYRTPTLRKPINYFIANMAMSDLLYPIFLFPLKITELYVDSWLIAGGIGLALCKLLPFLSDISTMVSTQSVVLIAVDRFGAVVVPLSSPVIGPKLCPFFILATWIVAMAVHSPYLFAHELVEDQGKLTCTMQWNDAFGESSSFANYFLAGFIVFFLHSSRLVGYTILHHSCQAQDTGSSRGAFGQRWGTPHEKKRKGAKNGHCYRVSICGLLGSFHY